MGYINQEKRNHIGYFSTGKLIQELVTWLLQD